MLVLGEKSGVLLDEVLQFFVRGRRGRFGVRRVEFLGEFDVVVYFLLQEEGFGGGLGVECV